VNLFVFLCVKGGSHDSNIWVDFGDDSDWGVQKWTDNMHHYYRHCTIAKASQLFITVCVCARARACVCVCVCVCVCFLPAVVCYTAGFWHDVLWLHLHLSSASHFSAASASFVNICNIGIFLLPPLGLSNIHPSVISSSKLWCLKRCPIQWRYLCWMIFIICLSTFANTSSFYRHS